MELQDLLKKVVFSLEVSLKKNNRFCCELVRSSSFATKSILIFILSLCICLIICTITKAGTIEEVSEEYVNNMLDFYANMYNQRGYTTKYNILQNAHADTVADYINNDVYTYINNYLDSNSNLNLENLIFFAKIDNDSSVKIIIIPAKSNTNNNQIINSRDIQYITYQDDNNAIKLNGLTDWIPLAVYFTIYNNNQISNAGINTLTGFIRMPGYINPAISGDYLYSDVLYAPSSQTKIYYNNTEYKIGNYYETVNQQIENTDQSEYGYLWSPASSGEARVNLLYNGNSNIDCDYYIGNALSHTYNFYYMSGDSKISVNNYISIYETQTTSGEWYKHYITNAGKENLQNNTHFLLDVYASLGNQTATVVEGFNAFYTVEEVIPTPTPIPTATPTPTPTPDIGTISGQINDINNNISNSTQSIVNTISEESEKITDTISKEITSGELESILPVSGDYVQQMGYKPKISPYNGFIINIYNVIKEALLGEGNVNLYVEYHGYSEYIASDRYYIPNNALSAWFTAGMVALICWEIAKFGDQITQKLEKADINVIHYADADMYFF